MAKSKYSPLIVKDYLDEVVANNRHLLPGMEVSILNEKGRFRFVNASVTSAGKLVCNFIGGAVGREAFRSFYPERIKRVHRLNQTRANGRDGAA